jgi:SulP family sulfate permease
VIGASATAFLFWVRKGLKPLLLSLGLKPRLADILAKAGPVAAVAVTTLVAWDLGAVGARRCHRGRGAAGPAAAVRCRPSPRSLGSLIGSAILISIIGFVESVSVAQTLAAKKRQRIVPDQELIGLGASNVAARSRAATR